MNRLLQIISDGTSVPIGTVRNVFWSLFVLAVIYVVRMFILGVIHRRKHDDIRLQYRWRKTTTYLGSFLAAFILWRIWFAGSVNISTYLGLLSAGMAVALKEPIENIAGWAFILLNRPFDVGHRIQVGDIRGDVIDQGMLTFVLMEVGEWIDAEHSTGRVLHVPNGRVFRDSVANYGAGFEFIWHEIPVLITFESDWKKAEKVLSEVVERHGASASEKAADKVKKASSKYMIFYQKLTPTVYTTVKDSGVLLTMRYLCEPRRRRDSEQTIWKDVLAEFDKHDDIELAYNTMRIYRTDAAAERK